IMPESELALAGKRISGQNSPVVLKPAHARHQGLGRIAFDTPHGCLKIMILNCYRAQSQELTVVLAVRKNDVAVLKEAKRKFVLLPGQNVLPMISIRGGKNTGVTIEVHRAGLDHGCKEDGLPHRTAVDRGTAEVSHSRKLSRPLQAINMILFERSIRGEVQRVGPGDKRHSTSLLVSGKDNFDAAQVG